MEKYTEWKKKIEKIISQVEGNVCINFYDLNFCKWGQKSIISQYDKTSYSSRIDEKNF